MTEAELRQLRRRLWRTTGKNNTERLAPGQAYERLVDAFLHRQKDAASALEALPERMRIVVERRIGIGQEKVSLKEAGLGLKSGGGDLSTERVRQLQYFSAFHILYELGLLKD